MTELSPHELSRFRPSHDTHWAVILNRGYVRAAIIRIRRARQGGIYEAGSEAALSRRLASDWRLYRWAMGHQELERQASRDIQGAAKMFDAIIAPMIRAAE